MKTYRLQGNAPNPDIVFTIADLIPVKQYTSYDYFELVALINYTNYQWNSDVFEYEELYRIAGNKLSDFFRIRDTDLIVIPGGHIFPTLLMQSDII